MAPDDDDFFDDEESSFSEEMVFASLGKKRFRVDQKRDGFEDEDDVLFMVLSQLQATGDLCSARGVASGTAMCAVGSAGVSSAGSGAAAAAAVATLPKRCRSCLERVVVALWQ